MSLDPVVGTEEGGLCERMLVDSKGVSSVYVFYNECYTCPSA
jgi:hypothetical protein